MSYELKKDVAEIMSMIVAIYNSFMPSFYLWRSIVGIC